MKTDNQLQKIFRDAVKPIKKTSVSEWADTYRQLPAESPEPGRWKTARTPYLKEIMDAFTQNEVHRVVVKSSSQIGKSECLNNVVARFVHLDPCNILIVQPTIEQAQDFSRSRISKMIDDTKIITPLFYRKTETILSKFFKGGRLVLVGANSAAGLASKPIRILLCDEVDRFPQSASGNEGDPISLAVVRMSNYWNYKLGIFSTPTTEGASRIEVEYLAGTQEEWQYKCPNCGEYHILDYRQMVTDFEEKIDEFKNKTYLVKCVKWRCPDCGLEFDELTMKNAPQKYIAQNPDALKNGVRSFWLNSFSSAWLSWNEIMLEYLKAKGSPLREQVVFNTRFGLTYKLVGEYDDENIFLNRRENYPAELPNGVLLLTGAVDVQSNRLEYEVVGWGFGEECYGIVRGIIRGSPNQISTWQGLDEVLDREYKFSNGLSLKVARCFIDSGYATKSVYDYCQMQAKRGRFPIKGKGGMGLKLLHQYTYPKGANVILSILGVDDGKQEVMSRLGIQTPGKMYFHFPLEDNFLKRGYDSAYFRQLISEHKAIRKSGGMIYTFWEPINPKARNESLDLRVYNLACMQSCVGNNGEKFWSAQAAALQKNILINSGNAKPASKEKTVVCTQMEIWQ